MLRFISTPLSGARPSRSVATQTTPAPPATRTRQTQTEPHLCLDCHLAQLVDLLRPGSPGRITAPGDHFFGGFLSPIDEEDEPGDEVAVLPAAARSAGRVLAESLLGPRGFPLRHVLLDADLLRLVVELAPQSVAERTAE